MAWRLLSIALALACRVACSLASSREKLSADFDPYALLRLQRGATTDAIRGSYRNALNVLGRAASKHGHGQEPDTSHLELMRSIGLAYRVLMDAGWRAEWDGAHEPPGAAPQYSEWDLDQDL